jgi:hypothetical protein
MGVAHLKSVSNLIIVMEGVNYEMSSVKTAKHEYEDVSNEISLS